MPISALLLPELDQEMKITRITLERVPADKPDFAPHPKSMPLGKLAPHVAQLAGFGLTILTTPELDFSKSSTKRLPLGMQIMGRALNDASVLKVARLYQSHTDWHLQHPDL